MSDTFTTLQSAVGASSYKLRFCPRCKKVDDVVWEKCAEFVWATKLMCTTCPESWYVCRDCYSVRTYYYTKKQLTRHKSLHHQHQPSTSNKEGLPMISALPPVSSLVVGFGDPSPDIDENYQILFSDDEDHFRYQELFIPNNNNVATNCSISDSVSSATPTTLPAAFNFSHPPSSKFFMKESVCPGAGQAHLVCLSQFKLDSLSPQEEVDSKEVTYHMDVARLMFNLTRGQRALFSSVMKQTVDIVRQRTTDAINGVAAEGKITGICTTTESIRKRYMTGICAMLQNLPRPEVRRLGNHSYVSLHECVADLLAHGLQLDLILAPTSFGSKGPVTKLSESVRAKLISNGVENKYQDKSLHVLYFNEWSDDFDPSSSSTKSNRGSVWIKTITISAPLGSVHSLTHTYPIAIGKKGANHDAVNAEFTKEMQELSTGDTRYFYSKSMNGCVPVHVEMMASLQDQPERRQANRVMLGGGKYSARWGYIMDFSHAAKFIPSCVKCLEALIHRRDQYNNDSCLDCLNWEITGDSDKLDFPPPEGYPAEEVSQINGKLRPQKMTFANMMEAITKAHQKLVSGQWAINNARSYLWLNGFNTDAINGVTECAINMKAWETLSANQHEYQLDYEAMMRDRERNPSSYQMWTLPSCWVRGTELCQHIDTPMHLLFLGIVKSTAKRLEHWLQGRNRKETFFKCAIGVLDSVQCMNLSWCRILPYRGGKFAGWVSENYVALARLMCWFYAPIEDIAEDPAPASDPIRPQNRWSSKENKLWLSSRGLDSNGYADTVRLRVATYIALPGGAPPRLPPVGGSVATVLSMIQSLHVVINIVMSPQVTWTTRSEARRAIKIFLSLFEIFDSTIRRPKDKPMWISSYNYACLLNIPGVMEEFGPLTNLWEGGGQGEKILQLVKPIIHGFRKNWQTNAMKRLLDDMSFLRMTKSLMDDSGDIIDPTDIAQKKFVWSGDGKYIIYRSAARVRQLLRRRRPFSAIHTASRNFVCVARTNGGIYIQLKVQHAATSTMGLDYFHIEVMSEEVVGVSEETVQSISHHCLFLPQLKIDGLPSMVDEPRYAIISSTWETYSGSGVFSRLDITDN